MTVEAKNYQDTILVVDDNPTNLDMLFTYLQAKGFKVLVAEDGESAIQRTKQAQPDIILLDVMMPKMDGFETCEQLKADKETKNIPVIFLTALAETADKLRGFDAGAVDYITKPLNNREALARIKSHLTIRRLQREMQAQNKRLKEENVKRRRVQDALRESRERYMLMAQYSSDMISRQTTEGIYRYVSPACQAVLGQAVEDVIGKRELDFIHPDDKPDIEKIYGNIDERAPVTTVTYRARGNNGNYTWLETTSRVIRDPQTQAPLEIISVSRNVTARKEAEEALQQAHDELEQRVEERTAELVELNTALRRFVPQEFVQLLGKSSITDVQLGEQIQGEMTILTSDIRSFTTLSETMTPEENFRFLNAYLGRVSPIIRRHKGVIDKYIGDAIMALFPEKPEQALQAAIAIRQTISDYNEHRKEQGRIPIEIGTAIHTGNLMLGTIGERERMETTAISDAVNLAFRLEGLTKLYGASIVISQDSLFNLESPTSYQFRFLDRVRVKGKSEPISVFEIFDGDPLDIVALKAKTQTDFEKGLLHYHSQEFSEAQTRFEAVLKDYPDDKAAQLYLKRASHFVQYGVPPDWEGIESLTEK